MNPIAIVLAISLLANTALGYAYLGQRDEAIEAASDRDAARGVAETCSKSVDDLQVKAAKRAKDAAPARAAAAASAASADKKADEILTTPASASDDCTAAAQRADKWLKGRK